MSILVHRIDFEKPGKPQPRPRVVTLPLGNFLQGLQRNDVLGIQLQNLLESVRRIFVHVFVEIASPKNDMGAGIVWPILNAPCDVLDGQVNIALLSVRIGKCRKPLFGVLSVALLELLDLRPICHGYSRCEECRRIVTNLVSGDENSNLKTADPG